MTPTATDSRINRYLDNAKVPSLLKEAMNRKRNKQTRLISTEILARSVHQSPCPCIADLQTMDTLVVAEHEAMDSTAREAFLINKKICVIDCMGMPDAVYPLMWSFLLDSTSTSGTASALDFKSILSFILVNKTSKGTFDDCRGWWLCAQALKREAEAKQSLVYRFEDQAMNIWTFYKESPYREEIKQAREMDSRILSIQSVLLPQANHLAVLHGSEKVTMYQYHSYECFISRVEYHFSVISEKERNIERLKRIYYEMLERSQHSRIVEPVTISPKKSCFLWILGLFYSQ
jgi:hypothetical protein